MIRVGIVGAGPMGRLHAAVVSRLSAEDQRFELTSIFDHHEGRADSVAADHETSAAQSLAELATSVDAAIVAVPTSAHFKTARLLLDQGIDLLIEKPLACDVSQGIELEAAAGGAGRIVQVGHIEWYNPAWRRAAAAVGTLRKIVVDRTQPYSSRGRDVDVIQDLMLHDLDWTTRTVPGEVTQLEARVLPGDEVRSADSLDRVEARLAFDSGCEVILKADRVARRRVREARFEGLLGRRSANLDLADAPRGDHGGNDRDPLARQWADFVEAVLTRQEPENSISSGIQALAWVERVRSAALGRAG